MSAFETVPLPQRMARLPKDKHARVALRRRRSHSRSLASQSIPLVSCIGARPAFPLAAPNHQVLSLVGMPLWAMGSRPLVDRPGATCGIQRLGNHLKVTNLDAVAVDASTLGDVVDRHLGWNRADLTDPHLAVSVNAAAEYAVAVGVVRALPSQAAGLDFQDRRGVVVPALTPWRDASTKPFVATGHRAILSFPTFLEDRTVTRLAPRVHWLAEALHAGARHRTETLYGLAFVRVVGAILSLAALAMTRHVHSGHAPILSDRTDINRDCIESDLPILRAEADAEGDGAPEALEQMLAATMPYLPADGSGVPAPTAEVPTC